MREVVVVVQLLGGALFVGSVAYLVLAFLRVARFTERRMSPAFAPPVTILVPVHGAPPRLYDCLRSICDQYYPTYQVVFGLHAAEDPGHAVIDRILAEMPERDLQVVIDNRRIGANPKNCNLANIYPAAHHDLIVMVDSDVTVDRWFLATLVRPFQDPAVGGVTCLYKGGPMDNLASRLGALFINDWFIPSVLVDAARRDLNVCFGAAIAVTRKALDDIGGFAAMASAVAQDFVFGHSLTHAGYKVKLAPYVVETVVAEPNWLALFRHELRWSRAVRAVRPLDHALYVFTTPLAPLAMLLLSAWPAWLAVTAVAAHVGLRLALHLMLRARIPLPPTEPWLVPAREVLNIVVWLASYCGRKVRWGSTVLVTGKGLTMRVEGGGRPGAV